MSVDRDQGHIFSLVGGALCIDFTNTVSHELSEETSALSPYHEQLHGYGDLLSWARQAEVVSVDEALALEEYAARHEKEAARMFSRAIRLRRALYAIFLGVTAQKGAPEAEMRLLKKELSTALAQLCIRDEGMGFKWQWDWDGKSLDRVLWPVVKSAADLLAAGDLTRVRECASDSCGWLFVDTSKNRSRRWCDMNDCGNRAKARRHYHKNKSTK